MTYIVKDEVTQVNSKVYRYTTRQQLSISKANAKCTRATTIDGKLYFDMQKVPGQINPIFIPSNKGKYILVDINVNHIISPDSYGITGTETYYIKEELVEIYDTAMYGITLQVSRTSVLGIEHSAKYNAAGFNNFDTNGNRLKPFTGLEKGKAYVDIVAGSYVQCVNIVGYENTVYTPYLGNFILCYIPESGCDPKDGYTYDNENLYWISADFLKTTDPSSNTDVIKTAEASAKQPMIKTGASVIEEYETKVEQINNPDVIQIIETETPSYSHVPDKPLSDDLVNLYNVIEVLGAPTQFNKYTDPRIPGTSSDTSNRGNIGRKYLNALISQPSVISIAPGNAQYLPFTSNSQKQKVTDTIRKAIEDGSTGVNLDDINTQSASFIGFRSAWSEYIRYFNLLCRVSSIYFGIGDLPAFGVPGGTTYKYYDYTKILQFDRSQSAEPVDTKVTASTKKSLFDFSSFFSNQWEYIQGIKQFVHFYGTADTAAADDITTSTRESALGGLIDDKLDGIAKEISFVFGKSGSSGFANDIAQSLGAAESESGRSVSNMLTGLINKGAQYFEGSRLVFPQIIDDVSYGRSISCSVKFTSPYGTPESRFLHMQVPLNALLAMSLPKQVDVDMYTYPFLVRASCRGLFTCDLGVLTDVRIKRGGDDSQSWTMDRTITEIEASFSITPLINRLMMSDNGDPVKFVNNTGLQDYLGTICGVNMHTDQVYLKMDTIKAVTVGGLMDIPMNVARSISDSAYANFIRKIIIMP